MKINVNKLDTLKRELEIEVPSEKVVEKFNQVYEQIKKEAKVPGFRQGTAPRHVLEKHHSKLANEEVIKQLLPETYQEALKKENLEAISLPEVTEVNLTGNSLSYKAKIELRPEIEIKDYKKIRITKRSNEVMDTEVEKAFESLKQTRKIETLTDEFARGLGYASLNDLKDAVKRQLIVQKEADNKAQLEHDVIDHLLKNSQLTVPQTLVERRFEELKHEMDDYLNKSRLPKEEIEKKAKEFEPKLKEQAEDQVKVFLILEEIAIKENIPRDDHMTSSVMEFLFKNAEWGQ